MIVEDIVELEESSGYSLSGSFTPDLVFSKLWLMRKLAEIQPRISTMYVLGAWYCNLAILLNQFQKPQVDLVINVEINRKFLRIGQKILQQMGADRVEYMLKDANDVDYRQLDRDSVVVNTSLTDMQGRDWFDRIAPGTVVVLQGRDHDANRNFHSANDIQRRFTLSTVLYAGGLALKDPQTEYTRFMIIGVK